MQPRPEEQRAGPSGGSDGLIANDDAYVALEQFGQWVRFADTKATILAAALGAVLTLLGATSNDVVSVIKDGGVAAWLIGGLGGLSTGVFAVSLWNVITAIRPRASLPDGRMNRFAWPSVAATDWDDFREQV